MILACIKTLLVRKMPTDFPSRWKLCVQEWLLGESEDHPVAL